MKQYSIRNSIRIAAVVLTAVLLSACQKGQDQEDVSAGSRIEPGGILVIDSTEYSTEKTTVENTFSAVQIEAAETITEDTALPHVSEHQISLPAEDGYDPGGVQASELPEELLNSETSIQIIAQDTTVNLSMTQIQNINQATLANPEAACYSLSGISVMSREQVVQFITAYGFPSCNFLNGHEISEAERQMLEANRNLEAIPENVIVEHGILTDYGDVRTYPTNAVISNTTDERAFDYFQESLFSIGEPVLVLHRSADGAYSFVVGANDKGWVESSRIGLTDAQTFDIWQEALKHPAVITEPYVKVEGLGIFRMGTLFPLLSYNETAMRIAFPRNVDGRLSSVEVSIPMRNDISAGFLPFTYGAAVRRMQQMIGVMYGWGDMLFNFDCSSTVGAVYRCFGIFLPRNTGNMHAIGASVTSLVGKSSEERRALILASQPGSLLLMRGHVVMFLGNTLEGPKIAHNVTVYSEDGSSLIEAYECRQTPLDIFTGSYRPYVDAFDYIITFQ